MELPISRPAPEAAVDETIQPVQGIMPNSKEEYRVALALYKLKIPFEFQVSYFGGRRLRGGQVIDFMLYNPWPQALQVFGEYWHQGQLGAEDTFSLARIAEATGREVLIAWGRDLATVEQAEQTIRKLV